ncbi:MAG: adhesin [Thermoplasmata archaeon]
MVTVTEPAKDLLQSIDHPPGTVLRLERGEGSGTLSLKLGPPLGDDQVVERDGGDLLHMPAMVSDALDGATIDAVETDKGTQLSISRG